jgi:exopolysaccharide production protein ExoZ
MKKIESIQLLRGICAIFILIYHLSFFGFGCFAVDIFFIISGFIMMYSTQKDGPILKKRLVRVIPLYYIVTILMFVLLSIIPSLSLMASAKIEYLIKSLLFIPYKSVGVGETITVVPLVGVAWTLNLEIYFYILFAICNKINHKYRGY